MLPREKNVTIVACQKAQLKCAPPPCCTHDHVANAAASGHVHLRAHTLLLEVLDVLLSCLVVAPCVIAYWRGTWELMGVLIYPNNTPLSAFISFLIGALGHLLFTLTQSHLKQHIHPDRRRLTYYAFSRGYTAVFGIVCVNMWRGAWVLCDWLTSVDSLLIVSVVTLVALLFLVATRTVRNLSAAPYTVTMDHKSDYFEVDTMFKIPGFHQPGLFVLDTLFSVFVIGTLVVIAWRGLWGILDLTFYTNDKTISAWGSLCMGYTTVFITFIIQPCWRCLCRRLDDDGLAKLILCDVFYFLTFFGAVNAWRGIWMLLDLYLYPDNPVLSYWLTHVIPFLVLAALKCANSILVRGVFIDADGLDGECVDVPINYVKLHFQRERSKKANNSGAANSNLPQQLGQQHLLKSVTSNGGSDSGADVAITIELDASSKRSEAEKDNNNHNCAQLEPLLEAHNHNNHNNHNNNNHNNSNHNNTNHNNNSSSEPSDTPSPIADAQDAAQIV